MSYGYPDEPEGFSSELQALCGEASAVGRELKRELLVEGKPSLAEMLLLAGHVGTGICVRRETVPQTCWEPAEGGGILFRVPMNATLDHEAWIIGYVRRVLSA